MKWMDKQTHKKEFYKQYLRRQKTNYLPMFCDRLTHTWYSTNIHILYRRSNMKVSLSDCGGIDGQMDGGMVGVGWC